jgi:hypothetical protein
MTSPINSAPNDAASATTQAKNSGAHAASFDEVVVPVIPLLSFDRTMNARRFAENGPCSHYRVKDICVD